MMGGRARTRTAFRTPRPGCQPTLPLEYPLDVIISITASTIAYDHRETSCEGPTGRRSRILAPEAFYHPVSVDLVNGDDPGGGVKYPTVPGAMVAVLLEALGADGKPYDFTIRSSSHYQRQWTSMSVIYQPNALRRCCSARRLSMAALASIAGSTTRRMPRHVRGSWNDPTRV